jgi:integrase/recombinase XerC
MRGRPSSSRPAITLPGPGAMWPTLPDYIRLLDTFLAGRNPRTLAAYQADLEDFRRFLETCSLYPPTPPTVGEAVRGLLENAEVMAGLYAREYRQQMRERGLQVTTINRRLSTLRSLVKLANTQGLVTWTLSVENVPAQPYRDIGEPGREGFRAMLKAAGALPGAKGLRDVALLRLLHDLGLRRSEAVRLDVKDVDLPRNWIFIPGRGRSQRSELVSWACRKLFPTGMRVS